MRIKCPHCNGKGFSELDSALNMTCGWCMGKGELDLEIVPTEPQTEQEYIQTCNTEQLADFLTKVILDDKRFRMTMVGGVNETKMWLKQPHHNEVKK